MITFRKEKGINLISWKLVVKGKQAVILHLLYKMYLCVTKQ